jgi:hypothetical protein
MKSLLWKLCLMAGVSSLALFGSRTPVFAAADNPGGPDERLQRLEQRINELADRQEQMMRRLGAASDNGGPIGRRDGAAAQFQGPMGRRGGAAAQYQGPMPAPGSENMGSSMPPAGPNPAMEVRIHRLGDLARLIVLGCLLCNILLAIWIFTDIRKRGEGSGIFIALALVAGIPAAIIYSLVRIGDKAAVTGK